MERSDKESELMLLEKCFSEAQIAVCAEYRGLSVAQMTNLRKQLRDGGSLGRVSRNTLAKLSAEKAYANADAAELRKFLDLFEGPNIFIFSSADPVSPTKIITTFKKEKENEKLKIKGAWMDGTFVDESGVEALSKMPGKQELFAKLLATINAPAQQVMSVIQASGGQLVRALEAVRKQKEGGE